MKTFTLCLILFGVCLAMSDGQNVLPSQSLVANKRENLRPLKRVARQDIPQPPDSIPPPPMGMPAPPGMLHNDYRKKREARGIGGALPTRKG
ncbi:jg14766 [Pararge aegeria aegeria]|uniref:Jg14766 protein n=1 Tax=Pararge aegeria aegeria TaxID=348720 RepID=A0A8S4SJ80_9NEOP|nr:jg14766 [Pararge aegeria aegeria]